MEIEIGQMEIIYIKAAMMEGNTSGSNPGCVEALRGSTVEDAMDLIEKRRPAADFADVYVRSVERFLKGRS